MDHNNQLEENILAISLTMPATKLGVPFIPFFLNLVICMFGWIIFQMISGSEGILAAMIFAIVGCLIYAFMLYVCRKDIFGLSIFWINLLHFPSHRTRAVWGNTDAYTP